MPIFFLRWKKKRKTMKFEKQMPEAMELLARSLRAGHTLPSTLELVAQEIPPPLGKEMRITYEEQRLGLSVSQALRRMSERVASQDLRYFVTAVLIQTETGGNLAEILENIGHLIRERLKLKGKVKALTAEGRFSALILIWLAHRDLRGRSIFLNRPYIMILLTDPMGTKILTGADHQHHLRGPGNEKNGYDQGLREILCKDFDWLIWVASFVTGTFFGLRGLALYRQPADGEG